MKEAHYIKLAKRTLSNTWFRYSDEELIKYGSFLHEVLQSQIDDIFKTKRL